MILILQFRKIVALSTVLFHSTTTTIIKKENCFDINQIRAKRPLNVLKLEHSNLDGVGGEKNRKSMGTFFFLNWM